MPEQKNRIVPRFDDYIQQGEFLLWALPYLSRRQAGQLLSGKAYIAFDTNILKDLVDSQWFLCDHDP